MQPVHSDPSQFMVFETAVSVDDNPQFVVGDLWDDQ